MAAITRYVRTDSAAGGDGTTDTASGANRAYGSLSEAEAAEQTDISSSGTVTFKCSQGAAGGNDTTQVTVTGWTTATGNIIYIRDNDGDANAKHDGRANDVTANGNYVLAVSGTAGALRLLEDYIDVEGIEIASTDATAANVLNLNVGALTATTNAINITDVILHATGGTGSANYIIDARGANTNLTCNNVIGYGKLRAIIGLTASTTLLFQYGTFFTDTASHGFLCAGETTCTNVVAAGYSTACFNSSAILGSHSAATDTTADNVDATYYQNSITAANEFVNASVLTSADFTLKTGGACENNGTAISVTTDIIGTTRANPPDIGAFEIVAAGGLSIPVAMAQYRQRWN